MMRVVRRTWFLVVVYVGLALVGFHGVGVVSATTGNNAANPVPAHYRVPHDVAVLYLGQYVLQAAAGDTPVNRGQMEIEINSLGYLQGVGSFYGYDAQGQQMSWVATFYNFHLTGPSTMALEVFDATGNHLLGTMRLQRSKRGDLSGQIVLPKKPYTVRFRRNVTI